MSDERAKTVLNSVDWWRVAACRDSKVDPELFFPIGYKDPEFQPQIEEAKAICRRCPAIGHCLLSAFFNHDNDGIFAGTTPDKRRELKSTKDFDPLEAAQQAHDDFVLHHPGSAALPPIIQVEDTPLGAEQPQTEPATAQQ